MKIGPHQLANQLFVAPMAGVTDRPFRQLCKKLGAGYAVSEMIASNALLWNSEKTQRRANHQGEFKPIAVQIAGADPAMMAAAAKLNVDHGAQIIDINMGCPCPLINISKLYLTSAAMTGLPSENFASGLRRNVTDLRSAATAISSANRP